MAERNMVNLTVTMTKDERKALKQISLKFSKKIDWRINSTSQSN